MTDGTPERLTTDDLPKGSAPSDTSDEDSAQEASGPEPAVSDEAGAVPDDVDEFAVERGGYGVSTETG